MAAVNIKNFSCTVHKTALTPFSGAVSILNFGLSHLRYAMRGKDSANGAYVYWTSDRSASETPVITSPALSGYLVAGSVELLAIERIS